MLDVSVVKSRAEEAPPTTRRAGFLGVFGVVAACASFVGAPLASAASLVVAKVGTTTITIPELERRLAAIPAFQLRAFGTSATQVKREFLDRVVLREALFSLGAADRNLEGRDDVKERIRGLLRTALLAKVRADVGATHIDDAEVKAYYDRNASKFHTPERLQLWIIASRRREEAVEIIADLHKDSSPKHWTEIARAKSVDGPTMLKGGNLGFVLPDGTTQEPGSKVTPALFQAAQKLKDAEISPEPIKDGERWVVVWRKQTMPPVDRSLEVEAGSIRQLLLHQRTDAKIKELIASLRKAHLSEHNADLVDLFDITPQGDLSPVRRPGSLPARRTLSIATPMPGGLR